MKQYYNIAGLNVTIDSFGRTVERANAYLCDSFECADISIGSKYAAYVRDYLKNDLGVTSMNDDELEYMATSYVFYFKLLKYDGLMLHSSAVVVDDRAYLFSADPGTGKSTHTKLWLEHFGDRAYILNDDKPAIRCENGVWYAYGTPWSGKHDISVNARVPLAGIAVLERGADNKIIRCFGEDIPNILMNQLLHSANPEYNFKALGLFDQLLSQVPIWNLQCNMDPEAAIVSYEAMSGKKFIPNK